MCLVWYGYEASALQGILYQEYQERASIWRSCEEELRRRNEELLLVQQKQDIRDQELTVNGVVWVWLWWVWSFLYYRPYNKACLLDQMLCSGGLVSSREV